MHSMDRLARNLDDLRKDGSGPDREGGARPVHQEENLIFAGEDFSCRPCCSAYWGLFAEFERSMIRERQREGIALAKRRRKGSTRVGNGH